MASINVKNQDEFNKLSWEDKFAYTKQNPDSMITNNEVLRTKNVLETNPTDSARNYAAGLTALRSGESLENVLGDSFDKELYGYKGASDNFKRTPSQQVQQTQSTAPNAAQGAGYSNSGDLKLAARDYINSVAGNRGSNYNIGFSNGLVTVNGRQIKPEYIENGVAYIKKKDIDGLLGSIDAERGRDTNRGILNENELKWAEDYNRALDAIRNREEFSYSKNEDPIYKEFERFYLNRAEKDAADIVANAAANTYGITNMGALVAADTLKKNRIEELAAYQKQFRDDAYSRYLDTQDRQDRELEQISKLRSEDLVRNWDIHRQDVEDERYNWAQDWLNKQYQQNYTEKNMQLDSAVKEKELSDLITAYDQQKLTGDAARWYRDAYGGNIENPYYQEDVEFGRELDQTKQLNALDLDLYNRKQNADLARDLEKYWAKEGTSGGTSGRGSSSGGSTTGSGLTNKYESKRNSLIKSINNAYRNATGSDTDVIEVTAAGGYKLHDGLNKKTLEGIEDAIVNNEHGLTENEQRYLYNYLKIGERIDEETLDWEALARAASKPAGNHR